MRLIAVAVIIAAVISLLLALGVHVFGPISGGYCSPIGSTRIDLSQQKWECVRNGQTGNGYWVKVP